MRSADLTFVILTKNEARSIGACLASLPAGSQALVYDAQSTDGTVAIAQSKGAQVSIAPWLGYVRARRDAANLVRTDWTFMLDADERLTASLAQELANTDPAPETVAYSIARRNYFCGRWIRSSGWWPDRRVRLFRTGKATLAARGNNPDAGVHESWKPLGASAEMREPVDHLSYESIADYRRKFALYTSLEAHGTQATLPAVAVALLLVPLRALWLLLIRGGVRDGWRGIYVSVASAVYPAAVVFKSWSQPDRTAK